MPTLYCYWNFVKRFYHGCKSGTKFELDVHRASQLFEWNWSISPFQPWNMPTLSCYWTFVPRFYLGFKSGTKFELHFSRGTPTIWMKLNGRIFHQASDLVIYINYWLDCWYSFVSYQKEKVDRYVGLLLIKNIWWSSI